MAIIIDNMKMPNTCYECALSDTCDLPNPYYVESTRAYECPLHEIIRCKDCKYGEFTYNAPPECRWYCKNSTNYHNGSFFCSLGEGEEDDN